MAEKILYFSGECRWAKLQTPDSKYGKHSIEVKLDEAGQAAYKESGLQGRPSKDGSGYYTFRRDPKQLIWKDKQRVVAGKPTVVDASGAPFDGLIGNGSTVTIKIEAYYYDNAFGKGWGGRLDTVRVDKLVEYQPDKVDASAPGVKVHIPF